MTATINVIQKLARVLAMAGRGEVMDKLNREIEVPRVPSFSDRIAGTGLLLFGALTIIVERSTALLLPAVALTVFTLARVEAQRISFRPSATGVVLWLALGFAALSSLWAHDPADALKHVGPAMIMLLSAQTLAGWSALQGGDRLSFLSFWLVVGFSIGIAFLLIEVVTSQAIKRFYLETFFQPLSASKIYLINKHGVLRIQDFELNRNVAAANMLLWPSLLCAWCLFRPSLRAASCALIFAVVGIATMLAGHETSKVAFLLAAATFGLAYLRPRLATWGVAAGFLALIVAIIPLSLHAHQSLKLERSDLLQFSAQERIVIWGTLAKRVLEAPVLGAGVRSTYTMNRKRQATDSEQRRSNEEYFAQHPHNVYLQVWFELGAVGALLLLSCGLSLLHLVSRAPAGALPFALAALVMGMIEIAFSWDLWQRWFFALLALSGVCATIAVHFAAARVALVSRGLEAKVGGWS